MSSNSRVHKNSVDTLPHTSYRPDIDGLRAIAVLAVVSFHAFPTYIGGGFIGVDIFFVISGFLISTILMKSLDKGVLSFTEFYIRRIRRIFPALTMVTVFCFALGWFTLNADEFKQLGKHIAGGAGFISNFLYWNEAGYFDNAAEVKPLLHLWSLGIEEQFYIVWPIALFVAWRRKIRPISFIFLLTAASFAFSAIRVKADPVAMFYSPVSRAWELMLGSIYAYLNLYPSSGLSNLNGRLRLSSFFQEKRSLYYSVKSILGILLIMAAVYELDKTTPFPGAFALLPALGAGLLISSGQEAWFNRKVLSNQGLVWLGLISYPLYLWHWPLLSFSRIFEGTTPRLGIRIAVVGLSVPLAWLTYAVVEKPIRFGSNGKMKAVILCSLLATVSLGGYTTYAHNGLSSRSFVKKNNYNFESPEVFLNWDGLFQQDCSFQADIQDKKLYFHCTKDSRGNVRYALIGDSKSGALYPSLVRGSSQNRWLHLDSFPLISNSEIYKENILFQQGGAEALLDYLSREKEIKVVVITIAVRSIFALGLASAITIEELPQSPNYSIAYEGLNATVQSLIAMNKKVVITIDNPTLVDPRSCMQRKTEIPYFSKVFAEIRNPGCTISYEKHLMLQEQYRRLIHNLKVENPQLTIYDPTHILCDIPANECSHLKNGKLLYSYYDHISTYSASLIVKELIPLVEDLVNARMTADTRFMQ